MRIRGRQGSVGRRRAPGFGWFFGGDAMINTYAMDALGQWELVAEELAFLAGYQRDDGKITHEISQAAARIDWFDTYPYAYYHADTTPHWMSALYHYWRASGDDALVRELWPAYRRAWAWCLSAETDGDGIIENTVGGLGAVEVGGLGESLHQDIYLAGVWVAAIEGTLAMAEAMGDAELAAEAGEIAPTARRTLNDAYWRPDEGHHAFGILAGGGTNDNLTVWPATAAAFGLLDDERAVSTLTLMAGDRVSSDWGAHMLSADSDLYDPLQYNMGTVWPFVTGFASWAQYRYRRPWAGFHLMDAIKQMTFDWSLGRHGELFSGTFYQPLDQTVPHQFFATSMLVTPLLRGVFGWEPDAPNGRARLAPQLPRTGRGRRCGGCGRATPRSTWRSSSGGPRPAASSASGSSAGAPRPRSISCRISRSARRELPSARPGEAGRPCSAVTSPHDLADGSRPSVCLWGGRTHRDRRDLARRPRRRPSAHRSGARTTERRAAGAGPRRGRRRVAAHPGRHGGPGVRGRALRRAGGLRGCGRRRDGVGRSGRRARGEVRRRRGPRNRADPPDAGRRMTVGLPCR